VQALVAFQRGGWVDEGVGFRDPSETGNGIGEGEVEECSDEGGDEVAWLGRRSI